MNGKKMFYAMPETVLSNCKNIPFFYNEPWEFREKQERKKVQWKDRG